MQTNQISASAGQIALKLLCGGDVYVAFVMHIPARKILCNEALRCMKEVENDKKSLETKQVSNVTGQKNHFLRKISCQHYVDIFGSFLYIAIY